MTRTPPLIGLPLDVGSLPSGSIYAHKQPVAGIIQYLAGVNRTQLEHLTGQEITGTQPSIAPRSAIGTLGHDHSGGYFGKPFKHTFWSVSYPSSAPNGGDTLLLSSLAYSPAPDSQVLFDHTFAIAVPPCHPNGCYEKATFDALMYFSSTESATLFANVYPDGSSEYFQEEIDVATGWGIYGIENIPLIPGIINKLRIVFYTTSTDTWDAYIRILSLSQVS